ncbi:MAG TPA: PQQ-dependent sugar dehydrogenase [Candidatus Limnocylindrales bacterium]
MPNIRAARRPSSTAPRSLSRAFSFLVGAALLAQILSIGAPVVIPGVASTAAAATLPSGFVDQTVVQNLSNPTVVAFAPGGRVFVAEKRGTIQTWSSLAAFNADTGRAQALDIRTDVMNYWDRGFLGMAVDPNWPTDPYLYILYTYDALPGGTAPRWGVANQNGDSCPNPPQGTTDGCVVTTRLDKVQMNPSTGIAVGGGRQQLLVGWCQQFPSHSAGSVVFGADGMLYVSGGEGASFNGPDWGQLGGTLSGTPTPINPCGDPPTDVGETPSAASAEGGALRSQSFRRPSSDAAVFGGAVLRIDPDTGNAAAGNPAIGNADPIRRRIVAFGFRNPFRMTMRPGTNDLYVGDVGYNSWEEVNRLPNPTAAGGPPNYGWPCHEGPATATYFKTAPLPTLCTSLSDSDITTPLYTYAQGSHMVGGDGCLSGGASTSGLTFAPNSNYPSQYRSGLFVADYTRNCIVFLPGGAGGVPTGSVIPFESDAAAPVMLTTDPNGDIVYPDFTGGTIHRIRYQAPTASFTATPASGPAPLAVTFDGSASSGPAPIVRYDWDFGDGDTDSDGGVTDTHTYAAGTYTARLTITDSNGITASTTRTVSASNMPPTISSMTTSPSCTVSCWTVGQTVQVTANATDTEDGTLPASAFSWHVGLQHCHSASDCHEHDLLDPSGVKTISLPAPDHEAGSFLRITVTVKDSKGLTTSKTIDMHPRETTITVKSSPAGLPVSLDGVPGSGSVSETAIVGHKASVQAQATAAVGESMYAFSSWSDGKALTHDVTVPSTATTLTATYRLTGTDAPDTCAAAPVQAVTGAPVSARFGKANDVDWVRFNVTKTGWYRIVLGDLPVDGTLALYSGCSSLMASVNQPGRHWEEILGNLKPGTYALKMTAVGGVTSSTSHRWWIKPLSGATPVLMTTTLPLTSTLRYAGDIFNTATSPRSITITARLYSSSGKVLKTATTHPLVPVVAGRARSPFVVNVAKPAGFAYVKFTITAKSASRATTLLGVTGTASAPTPSSWKVTGTITNTSSTTAHNVAQVVEIYDSFGTVANGTVGYTNPRTLAKGAKAPFTVTFVGLSAAPSATTLRARAT